MRQRVALYRDPAYDAATAAAARGDAMEESAEEDDDDVPEVRCPPRVVVRVRIRARSVPKSAWLALSCHTGVAEVGAHLQAPHLLFLGRASPLRRHSLRQVVCRRSDG